MKLLKDQLALPPNIKVHNVFHISILKRYVHDVSHVINWNVVQVEPEGEFQVGQKHILVKRERLLWNHNIGQVKVQWKHLSSEEATWELEINMWEAYPDLFQEDVMAEWKKSYYTNDSVIFYGKVYVIPPELIIIINFAGKLLY